MDDFVDEAIFDVNGIDCIVGVAIVEGDKTILNSICDRKDTVGDEAIGTVDFRGEGSILGIVVVNEDIVDGVGVIVVVIDLTGTGVVVEEE